jgi:hypothetical protein
MNDIAKPRLVATPEAIAIVEEIKRRIDNNCGDADWAYLQIIEEVMEKAAQPAPDRPPNSHLSPYELGQE